MPVVAFPVNGFWKKGKRAQGEQLCYSVLHQARSPHFYKDWGVPDTLEGRFDCASLHLILLLRHLKGPLAQAVFDAFFSYMELTLREIGVSDLRVGKQVKQCASFFYGAAKAYERALENKEDMEQALDRNLYGSVSSRSIHQMASYVRACDSLLKKQMDEGRLSLKWPPFNE